MFEILMKGGQTKNIISLNIKCVYAMNQEVNEEEAEAKRKTCFRLTT